MKLRLFAATLVSTTLAFSTAALGQVAANCEKPTAPSSIPDGSTASESELVETQSLIQQFARSAEDYLQCLQAEAQTVAQNPDRRARNENEQKLVDMHNQMVDELQATVDAFNKAVRDFQSRG